MSEQGQELEETPLSVKDRIKKLQQGPSSPPATSSSSAPSATAAKPQAAVEDPLSNTAVAGASDLLQDASATAIRKYPALTPSPSRSRASSAASVSVTPSSPSASSSADPLSAAASSPPRSRTATPLGAANAGSGAKVPPPAPAPRSPRPLASVAMGGPGSSSSGGGRTAALFDPLSGPSPSVGTSSSTSDLLGSKPASIRPRPVPPPRMSVSVPSLLSGVAADPLSGGGAAADTTPTTPSAPLLPPRPKNVTPAPTPARTVTRQATDGPLGFNSPPSSVVSAAASSPERKLPIPAPPRRTGTASSASSFPAAAPASWTAAPSPSPAGSPVKSRGGPRPIDPRARRRYDDLFEKLARGPEATKAVNPRVVVVLWGRSKLSKDFLKRLWEQVAPPPPRSADAGLDKAAFAAGLWAIDEELRAHAQRQ